MNFFVGAVLESYAPATQLFEFCSFKVCSLMEFSGNSTYFINKT